MAFKKDQGRLTRMAAFWALTILLAYGCLGGLPIQVNRWMGEGDTVLIEHFPLVSTLRVSTLVGVGVLLLGTFIIHLLLNRPKSVTVLIDTETELRKVTWPTWAETWNGTFAVIVTVIVLFFYLTFADMGLLTVLKWVMGVA